MSSNERSLTSPEDAQFGEISSPSSASAASSKNESLVQASKERHHRVLPAHEDEAGSTFDDESTSATSSPPIYTPTTSTATISLAHSEAAETVMFEDQGTASKVKGIIKTLSEKASALEDKVADLEGQISKKDNAVSQVK